MKIERTKGISEVDKTPPPQDRPLPRTTTDRVSVEAGQKASELVDSARKAASNGRAARLENIEAALRSGTYRPNPGQLAEKLLAAAEIDARLRALLR